MFSRGQYFEYEGNSDTPSVKDRMWLRQDFHYDDLINAMLTLFTVTTGEGWPRYDIPIHIKNIQLILILVPLFEGYFENVIL